MPERRLIEALLLLLPLAALPAVLLALSSGEERYAYPAPPRRIQELVITSPQWEGIKVEFEDGFKRWLYERDGSGVDIKWLDHGGGTKTVRWIEEQFQQKPDSIGVDLLFGGGTDPYETLGASGLLLRYDPPAEILDGVAESIGGYPILDPQRRWFGTTLTGFGIMLNLKVFEKVEALRGLVVRDWRDLADPRLFGWVGGADPRGSSSHHTFHEILLQAYGFEEGMRVTRLLGANCSAFLKFSAEIPKSCAVGQVACAPTIDHYAQAQIEMAGDFIAFVLPEGKTLVNADAAGILKGAPHLETAERFIDFLLSREAGLLWMLRTGEEGGPRRHPLCRATVRPRLFAETAGRSNVRENPFLMEQTFRYDYDKASLRWTMLNDVLGALVIDTHAELQAAVQAYHALEGGARERAAELLFRNPFSEEEMLEIAGGRWRDEASFREQMRIDWADFARQNYRAVAAMAGGAR
ncbi:MAG: ABC transporter substrate-binding protein [Planctomycetes bacterium]|nr:ABC transporter substrate-binding protein [Planctomycetota bacterium]